MYKKILIILVILSACHKIIGQDTLSLSDAISTALDNNFEIKMAENNVEIANNNFNLGNAGFLPQIDATANYSSTVENTRQEFIENRTQERDGAKSNRLSAGMGIGWTIFDGTRMFVTYDKLEEIREASMVNSELVIENVIADIAKTYYSVLLEQMKMKMLFQIKKIFGRNYILILVNIIPFLSMGPLMITII